ncbi:MAG: YkgJ family cysteine cluster protein [Verrucomicrobiales bacterium]|nr:YkgJ family cysteine cluster protein [Verrucomicrobiales bacterium]
MPETRALLAEVRSIYDELAARPVPRNCTGLAQCCQFRLTGRTPFLTKGEALVAAQGLRVAGKKSLPIAEDGGCPLLRNNRCLIYDSRPFGCRTHFCRAAGGPMPRDAVRDLIQRLETIDIRLGGSGAVNLPSALAAVL